MVQTSAANIRDEIIRVVDELPTDRMAEVLDFALFVKQRQAQQQPGDLLQPVQRLETFGAIWPTNESDVVELVVTTETA